MLTPEENAERLALYNQGLSDYAIAKIVYLTPRAIFEWRKKRNLPNNNEVRFKKKEKERWEYYNQGMTDTQIAHRVKQSRYYIEKWRNKNHLKRNVPK